jgi:DNA-binding transcriptional MerR regulator
VSWQSPTPDPVRPARASRSARVERPAPVPDGVSIREVCAATGLSPRTVRYYEELGLLPGVRRRAGGRRVYGPDELERLRFVQRLKAMGLSLEEVRELNAVHAIGGSTRGMLARLDQLLARRLEELDARIAELRRLRDEIAKYRARVASRRGALHAARRGAS